MKNKLIAVILMLSVCVSILVTGCSSSDDAALNQIDAAALTDTQREEYISKYLVADGTVLSQDDYEPVSGSINGTDGMSLVLETDEFGLYVDFSSTAIAVVDKREEAEDIYYYHSNPEALGLTGASNSVLEIEAYDSTNKKYEFNTTDNCIDDPTYYKVVQMKDGHTIRLIYTIGNDPDKELVPPVLTEATYNRIVQTLQTKADETGDQEYLYSIDDLSNLYKRLDPENLSMEDREKYQTIYPTITIEPLYVVRTLTQRQKQLVRSAMEAAGFTVEMLKQELTDVEYAGSERAVLFTIPVDIALTEDGITASIDSTLVLSPQKQKLYKIDLLPYFGAITSAGKNSEYFIVPDGSGALINIKGNMTTDSFNGRVYGEDETFMQSISLDKKESITSGFYVFDRAERGGFISVIEEGAGQSYISVTPIGQSSRAESSVASAGFELVYSERDFRSYSTQQGEDDESSSSSSSSSTDSALTEAQESVSTVGSGVVTSKEATDTQFKVHYIMNKLEDYTGEQYTYVDYAKMYREYLIDSGRMSDEKVTQQKTPFYLELMGAIDKGVTRFGMPVTIKQPLTTYTQALEIANKLYEAGIDGSSLIVRYNYWANDGYFNTVNNNVRLLSEMGSEKELKELANTLAEKGSGFYPSADFLYVYKEGGGLNYQADTARRLDKSVARVNIRSLATGVEGSEEELYKTIVSPGMMLPFATSYLKSYEKLWDHKQISMLGVGQYLNSNYKTGSVVTREQALQETVKTLELYQDYSIMVDQGNDYTWGYADHIIDIPMGSSEYLSSTGSIPFLQIVLHGYVNYTGEAFNTEADYTTSILKAVETGAGVHFRWMAAENSIFQNTSFANFYSLNYNDSFDEAIDAYTQVSKVVDLVVDQEIDQHEEVEAYVQSPYIGDIESASAEFRRTETDNVFMTTFENGVQVLVNYNSYNIELEDRTVVEAQSFVYREEESSEWTK